MILEYRTIFTVEIIKKCDIALKDLIFLRQKYDLKIRRGNQKAHEACVRGVCNMLVCYKLQLFIFCKV